MPRKTKEAAEPQESAPGYYAAEDFKTTFQGQFLSYKEGDLIPDHVGEFLLATGSPVEKREG